RGAENIDASNFRPAARKVNRPILNRAEVIDPSVQQREMDRLRSIWSRTVPLCGSLGETYLTHRRCTLPPLDSDVRFLPGTDRHPPSLCSLVSDAPTGKPMTLHFTRLRADGLGKAGTERDKLLLAGHPKVGGVVRIFPDDAVGLGLGVA